MSDAVGATATDDDFEAATRVVPDERGGLRGRVDARWSAPTGPNGGYLAAIVARAVEAAVPDETLRLRSLTCHYTRPPADGPVELEVVPLREGRRAATVRVALRQDGRDHVHALATLVRAGQPEPGAWHPVAPEVAPAPAPDAEDVPIEDYGRDGPGGWIAPMPPAPPITQRLRIAPRIGGAPFRGGGLEPGRPARAGGWMTTRTPHVVDAALLALATDAWWPPAFGPLDAPAAAPTLDLTVHLRGDVPRGGVAAVPLLGDFRTTLARDGLVEEDGTVWHPDGTLLAQSRQLALLMPVEGGG